MVRTLPARTFLSVSFTQETSVLSVSAAAGRAGRRHGDGEDE